MNEIRNRIHLIQTAAGNVTIIFQKRPFINFTITNKQKISQSCHRLFPFSNHTVSILYRIEIQRFV